MHRLLVDSAALDMDCAVLSKDCAVHLKVLRPKDGEGFELFDGQGSVRTYEWSAASRQLVAVRPSDRRAFEPPQIRTTLFACITKGQRWDWTLQKATELGVSRIVPVVSERTIVRIAPGEEASKGERWRRICEEAARQSDAVWLPEVAAPMDFASAVRTASRTACFAGALTMPPPEPLAKALAHALAAGDAAGGREFSVFIGPEGDFTPVELEELLAVATPTSFGPTILRAETAAIYALSVLKAVVHAGDEIFKNEEGKQ